MTESEAKEIADKYEDFFDFMEKEHNVTLMIYEVDQIREEIEKLNEKLK